ncbi:MAG: transposase [Microvirga sp.]
MVYHLDEAHIHQDCDLAYGWAQHGKRFWVASSSPGLSARVSFYGLYLYNEGQVRLWPYRRANGEHTIEVLRRLRAEAPDRKLIVLWDGAPYHRAKAVRMVATDPPPLEWPILKYGFQAEGGSRCARSDIPPKRSFPSCARSMFGSPRAPRWRMPFARSG